ncbi:MAG: zinc ribbon domain-containing protein [Thermoguttaceae bacterium]|nr:zinc ribbon domain-containing protein [Thermoguttaceae bacterium]MBR3218469.1 zinc ribbon domain-containing protein [Thermoguttaceae bacterium]
MPVYEYRCAKCQAEFELLIRGSQTPVCPECGSKKLIRHMSAPAGHVTGSSTPCPAASGTGHTPHQCSPGCGCHHCPHDH